MSFPGRTRLVRLAVLGLAVAAVGAPASFAQEDPYSGEGYGGTMDSGAALSDSSAAVAEPVSGAQRQTIPVQQPSFNDSPSEAWNGFPSDPWTDACATFPGLGMGPASLLGPSVAAAA